MTESVEALLIGLDNATAMVDEMLESSFATREQYICERDAALSSYVMDIGRIDEEFEQVAAEQKRRKKALGGPSKPEANHSLNYHMAQKKTAPFSDGGDVFLLPSEDNENLLITEVDDASEFSDSSKTRSVASTKMTGKATKPSETEQMQLKHDSRSSLLTKMENYRAEEADLLKQLAEAVTEDGMHSSLTLRERQDIEDELERCRARQARDIVASINEYRPRLNTKITKATALNNTLNSIEHILADATRAPSDSRSIRSNTPRSSKNPLGRRIPRDRKQPKDKTSKCCNGSKLFLSSTNRRETEQAVLQDPDHFLAVHELAIKTQKTRHRLKDNQSNASANSGGGTFDDVPRPVKQSLLQLVECNTRPLNPLELGRRNRVDSVRRI
jgi:hypothetical protein